MEARRWYRGCIGRVGALAVALGIGIALVTMPSVAWAEPADSGTRSISTRIRRSMARGRSGWLADEARARAASDDELAEVARWVDQGGGRAWASEEAHRRAAVGMDAVARAGIAEGLASQLRALTQFLVDREA